MKKLALLCACLGVSHAFALEVFSIKIINNSDHIIGLFQSANNYWDGDTGNIPLDPYPDISSKKQLIPQIKDILPGAPFSYTITDDHKNDQGNHGLAFGIRFREPRNKDSYAYFGTIAFDVVNVIDGAPWVDFSKGNFDGYLSRLVFIKGTKEHELNIYVYNDRIDYEVDQSQYPDETKKSTVSLKNNNLMSPYNPRPFIMGTTGSIVSIVGANTIKTQLQSYADKLSKSSKKYNFVWDSDESDISSVRLGIIGKYSITTHNSANTSVHFEDIESAVQKCEYKNAPSTKLGSNIKPIEQKPVFARPRLKSANSGEVLPKIDPDLQYFIDNTLYKVIANNLKSAISSNPGLFYNELFEPYLNGEIPLDKLSIDQSSIKMPGGFNPQLRNAINIPGSSSTFNEGEHKECSSQDGLINNGPINQTLASTGCEISVSNSSSSEYNSSDINEIGDSIEADGRLNLEIIEAGFKETVSYSHSFVQGSSKTYTDEKNVTYQVPSQSINVPPYCRAVVGVDLGKVTISGRSYMYATIDAQQEFAIGNSYPYIANTGSVASIAKAGILPWSSSNSATTKTTPKLGATAPSANEQNVTPTLGTRLLQKLKAFNSKWLH